MSAARSKSRRTTSTPRQASLLPPATDTEVEAYKFILDQLNEHGWNIKNPSRVADGQVWTQNQCLTHAEIKRALGAMRPENIVKLSESRLWIIEAKRDRKALDRALKEAAVDYAEPIHKCGALDVPFISGVAGNETSGYLGKL